MDIILTDKAKSKAFHLLSTGELKHAVQKMKGKLYIDQDNNTRYLFYNPNRHDLNEEIVILFKEEENKRVVITQMHDHGIKQLNTVTPA